MKAKDVIAVWIIVLFVLGALLIRAFYGLTDSLNQHKSWCSILLQFGFMLIAVAAGIFLIIRFTKVLHNLKNFDAEERQKQKDVIQ